MDVRRGIRRRQSVMQDGFCEDRPPLPVGFDSAAPARFSNINRAAEVPKAAFPAILLSTHH
jgi:hypothetical protein